jgi:hypothetical protein
MIDHDTIATQLPTIDDDTKWVVATTVRAARGGQIPARHFVARGERTRREGAYGEKREPPGAEEGKRECRGGAATTVARSGV